jgi:hypothetical protein
VEGRARVGEGVVRRVLGDGRHDGRDGRHEEAERDDEPHAPAHLRGQALLARQFEGTERPARVLVRRRS